MPVYFLDILMFPSDKNVRPTSFETFSGAWDGEEQYFFPLPATSRLSFLYPFPKLQLLHTLFPKLRLGKALPFKLQFEKSLAFKYSETEVPPKQSYGQYQVPSQAGAWDGEASYLFSKLRLGKALSFQAPA